VAVRQDADPWRREQALEEIRRSLSSEESEDCLAGLWAVTGNRWRIPDRTSCWVLVLPHLRAKNPTIRAAAVQAFSALQPGPEDLPRLYRFAADPSPQVRRMLGQAILAASGWRPGRQASDVLLTLLDDEWQQVVVGTVGSLSLAKSLPEDLADRIVDLAESDNREVSRMALRTLVANLSPKTDRTVSYLLRCLDAESRSDRSNAYRALRNGIREHQRAKVADAVVACMRKNPRYDDLAFCLAILRGCARESHVRAAEGILARADLDRVERANLEKSLTDVRARLDLE
jgi:hypothetical protein